MRKSFFPKIALTLLIFIAVCFAILCTFTPIFTTHYLEKKEASLLYREATYVASDYAAEYYNEETTLEEFQKQIETVSRYLSANIWIISPTGEVLLTSESSNARFHTTAGDSLTVDDFDITDFGNQYYTIGDFYDTFDQETLTVFASITVNYKMKGYVLIHKPVETITDSANDITWISYYTVGILILILILAILIWAFFYNRTLNRILDAAKTYSTGDYRKQITTRRNDELSYIANTLNYMATELDTLEEDQKKFISNVSHDFRSPLTSIKGYVEAIKDGTIPVEMQGKYLDIILFETERLTKLTHDLLDLNQMGHGSMRLDLSDFDINQMIRTTIMTFEGTCQKKGLSFDLVLTEEHLYVHADFSKIQQVLYNLIDNATKFSHNNTAIKIETNLRNDKVFVSVKDHGIGIPQDSIKKIWDRFYKTDQSRGKDKRGTGLGLAIVKEIINEHHEHINVISTEGVGTEFTFSIPLAEREKKRRPAD